MNALEEIKKDMQRWLTLLNDGIYVIPEPEEPGELKPQKHANIIHPTSRDKEYDPAEILTRYYHRYPIFKKRFDTVQSEGHNFKDITVIRYSDGKVEITCSFHNTILELIQTVEEVVKKEKWDGLCECGHKHSAHAPINSHNYTAGRCYEKGCNCQYFL